MIRLLTKNTFLHATTCLHLGWLAHHNELPEDTSADGNLRRLEGIEINERARTLYPSGQLITGRMQEALVETKEALNTNPILFEAAFSTGQLGTRADILIKEGKGYHLIEVKSGKEAKKDYIDDAAYTTLVLRRAGLKINTVSLMLVSGDYRKGMPNEKLFVEEDITDDVNAQVKMFDAAADQLCVTLNAAKPPVSKLILACRSCPVFEDCTGKGLTNHILEIPRISEKLFTELFSRSILKIDDIPPTIKLTDNQKRVWDSVRKKVPVISPDFKKELKTIIWPAWYLDFETCMTALPLYDDVGPYAQIVTQYSIHQCSAPGIETAHFEYLADPGKDCRRDIAENLATILQGKGSIIVYSSYEKGIINGLAELFPDLAGALHKIVERLVDLCALLRSHYYHPGFRGSYSIKRVLPVMVPDLDYSDLGIKEGGTAAAQFAFMAMGHIKDAAETATIRKNLLAYCKRDTLAMVKLHEAIELLNS